MDNKIWLTSDLHFCHDREFVYKPRGFNSVEEMNTAIVTNWNSVVLPDDTVYCLGDMMLYDNLSGFELIKQLNGKIHIILGNHDSANREKWFALCPNVVEITLAARLRYRKRWFFMTHYPCFTGNFDDKSTKQTIISLFGHTHQQTNFYNDIPFMYHVGLDSHNCTPVCIDQIIEDIKNKKDKLKEEA